MATYSHRKTFVMIQIYSHLDIISLSQLSAEKMLSNYCQEIKLICSQNSLMKVVMISWVSDYAANQPYLSSENEKKFICFLKL
jgi:hypothetical protein